MRWAGVLRSAFPALVVHLSACLFVSVAQSSFVKLHPGYGRLLKPNEGIFFLASSIRPGERGRLAHCFWPLAENSPIRSTRRRPKRPRPVVHSQFAFPNGI